MIPKKIMEFHEISMNFMEFHEFHERRGGVVYICRMVYVLGVCVWYRVTALGTPTMVHPPLYTRLVPALHPPRERLMLTRLERETGCSKVSPTDLDAKYRM